MAEVKDGEDACIYSSNCSACPGKGKFIKVQFVSGEVLEIRDVVDVEVTRDHLTITRASGAPIRSLREDVYYAGCGCCLPPALS